MPTADYQTIMLPFLQIFPPRPGFHGQAIAYGVTQAIRSANDYSAIKPNA